MKRLAFRHLAFRERLAAVLVVAFLVVQVAVPLMVLGEPGTARFGWQMFSRSTPAPLITVVRRDGHREVVDLEDLTPVLRGDVPYEWYVGPHLCRRPEVATVLVVVGPGEEVVHRCG